MSQIIKSKEFLLALVIISFFIGFVPYFVTISEINLNWYSTKFQLILAIVTSFTVFLGIYSQYRRGLNAIRKRSRGWFFKAYMLVCIIAGVASYFYNQYTGPWRFVNLAIISPLSTVNYGIIVFFMASTAARAFRARNIKAMMLLITAFVVLMDQAPLTGVFFSGFTPISLYLQESFVVSVGRMFTISMTIGALIYGVRVLLGMESGAFGITDKKEEK